MARTFTVSTAFELYSVLRIATGGETILLRPGEYGGFALGSKSGFNTNFPSTVTITSADPSRPAVFTGLDLNGTSNLAIRNVTFDYRFTAGQGDDFRPNQINGSTNISITGSTFDGAVAIGGGATLNGFGTAIGLSVTGSRGITVSDNEMFNWKRGLVAGNSSDLTITRNDIHEIRSDGMNFASVQRVRIEDNYIHNFRASYDSTDHRDMIQFWTSGTTTPSTDIVIRGNKLDIGDGSFSQSIFMRNEAVDTGQAGTAMFYRNILIENNEIYNGHLHGITVGATAGLTIRNNSVLTVVDENNPTHSASAVWVPTIRVTPVSTNVVVEGNAVAGITGHSGQAGWVVQKNAIIQNSDPFKPGYYNDVFIGSTLDADKGEHSYVALPGSILETIGAGAPATRHAATLTSPEAFFNVAEDPVNGATRIFDASFMAGALGIADQGAAYHWNFGDGTTASGKVVSHAFATAGSYDVKLTIGLPNGTVRTGDADVAVQGSRLVSYDGTKGAFEAYSLGTAKTMAAIGSLDGEAIQLGATGTTATIWRGAISDLRGSNDFAIDFTLKGDVVGGSGEIFRQHGSFIATMGSTGQLSFALTTSDGRTTTLTTTGPRLNDGQAHDISIQLKDGTLRIETNGAVNVERAVAGSLPETGSWDLVFGNPWGRANFAADLSRFDISVDVGDYPAQPQSTVIVPHSFNGVFEPPPPPPPLPPEVAVTDNSGMHDADWAGRVFDIGAMAGNTRILMDNARVTNGPEGPVLHLDGDKDYAVLGRQMAYEHYDRLGFSVDFRRDVADGSTDRLIWNHLKVGLTLVGDGLMVQVATATQGFRSFTARDIGLNDTDLHRAELMLDTVNDRLQVVVDSEVVMDVRNVDFELTGAGGREAGWTIGTAWDRFFDGEVHDFRLGDRFDFLENYVPAPNALLT